jgi:hypothetical protein
MTRDRSLLFPCNFGADAGLPGACAGRTVDVTGDSNVAGGAADADARGVTPKQKQSQ